MPPTHLKLLNRKILSCVAIGWRTKRMLKIGFGQLFLLQRGLPTTRDPQVRNTGLPCLLNLYYFNIQLHSDYTTKEEHCTEICHSLKLKSNRSPKSNGKKHEYYTQYFEDELNLHSGLQSFTATRNVVRNWMGDLDTDLACRNEMNPSPDQVKLQFCLNFMTSLCHHCLPSHWPEKANSITSPQDCRDLKFQWRFGRERRCSARAWIYPQLQSLSQL